MIAKLKEFAIRQQLAKHLDTYHIELKHYLPGRLRIVINNWRRNEGQIMQLAEELKQDPDVQSIAFTKETGSVLIHFNPEAIQNRVVIERWLRVFQKYTF